MVLAIVTGNLYLILTVYLAMRIMIGTTIFRDFKNNHTFQGGLTIRLERNVNNLNHRETMPVQGELLAPYMDAPVGSTIIFHHNSIHPSNEIYNHSELSGEEIASNIGIYAIPESECYLWKTKDMTEYQPIKGYAIGLRCFEPYIRPGDNPAASICATLLA